MSTVDAVSPPTIAAPEGRMNRWLERVGDWFNPILVKEVRQSLKSRQFVLTFLLLLVGAWLVSFLSIMWGGDRIEFGNMGNEVFWWYYLVLSVSMFVIVPFTAFRSLLAERDDNTFDLLSITTLAPRQIVRGKLLSAMVQLFIFYSAVTPFVAFTSMLKGFQWMAAVYVLVLSVLVSILACMFSLMIGTLAKTRTWQALLSIALLIGLIALFVSFSLAEFGPRNLGIAGAMVSERFPHDEPMFWWVNGIAFVVGLSYLLLFQQIAVARMTFESDNHSTGVRVICFLQFALAWTCVFSVWIAEAIGNLIDGWYLVGPIATYLKSVASTFTISARNFLDGAIPFFVSLSLIHFACIGLFASTERLELSRRLRRGLPKRTLFRLFVAPWLPGGGRGFLYLLLSLASVWMVVAGSLFVLAGASVGDIIAGMFDSNAGGWGQEMQFTTAGCCYVAIYCGIGLLLTTYLLPMSGELKPAHTRIVTVLLALMGIIVPYLIRSFGVEAFQQFSLLLITVPFDTLERIESGRNTEVCNAATILLMMAAAGTVLLNMPALWRGVGELFEADPERLQRIDDARHGEIPEDAPPVET